MEATEKRNLAWLLTFLHRPTFTGTVQHWQPCQLLSVETAVDLTTEGLDPPRQVRDHTAQSGDEGYSCRRRRLAVRPQLDWAGANQRILEDLLIDQMRIQCKWQVIKFITNAYGKIVEMIFESSKIIAIKL